MNGEMTLLNDEDSMMGAMLPGGSPQTVSTAIQVMAAMADKRIATARMYPRSVARFKQEAASLLREDLETARSAEYAKPVGGGTVKGPSIRLAELAAMCWGNLEVEVSEPFVGDKSLSIKAIAWDLQRNYRQESVVSVSILKKDGSRYPQHMIDTMVMATASKAKRNAIISVIPRAYIQDLLAVAKEVASGNKKPLEQQRTEALEAFARNYKVTAEQIYKSLNVQGLDDLDDERLNDLRNIYTSLKDGEAKVEEFFESATESKTQAIKDKLSQRKESAKTATAKGSEVATNGALPGMATEQPTNIDALKR